MERRDEYLDLLRGVAIVWVVVVHVFYLKLFVPIGSTGEVVKGLILFEMPLMFFVSGASLFYSHVRMPAIGPFLWRRMSRLLPPYLLLAVVCVALYYRFEQAAGHATSFEQVKSWLLLRPWPVVPVYVGAYLWFVRVVLGVTLAHLVLVRLFQSRRSRALTLGVLVVAIVAFTPFGEPAAEFYAVSIPDLPRYVVFYGTFLYLGYYYASGRLQWSSRRLALLAAGSLVVLAGLALAGVVAEDAQDNKFPPNVGYALFGLTWLALWLALRPAVLGLARLLPPLGAALRSFGTHSYTVFLWHGFGLWAADYALPYLRVSDRLQEAHYLTWMAVYFVFALAFTAAITATIDGSSALVQRLLDRQPAAVVPSPDVG